MLASLKRQPLRWALLGACLCWVGYRAWDASPYGMMEHMCSTQTFRPPIDCHADVPFAQSKTALAGYEQQVKVWVAAPLSQSQNLFDPSRFAPKFWTLPLRFGDRVTAQKIRTAAQQEFNRREEVDVEEGLKTGRYHNDTTSAHPITADARTRDQVDTGVAAWIDKWALWAFVPIALILVGVLVSWLNTARLPRP